LRNTGPVDVSIVMPCLNEEGSVAMSVRKASQWLDSSGLTGEVVVVDNGSDDHSVDEAMGAGARVIFEARRGYGSALRRGIASARGRWVFMGDCDETYDYSDLDPFIKELEAGADVVVGNRYAGGIQPGAMTWSHRYLGTPVLTFLVKLFSQSNLGDSQCGLRAFSRRAYDAMDLHSDGMEFASEMIIKATRLHLNVAEVPIQYYPRIGEAKLETFRDGWRHLRYLLLATPNIVFALPGLLFALAGAGILGASALSHNGAISVGSVSWHPIYAGAILLILGLNALFCACVANLYTVATGITPHEGLFYRLGHSMFRFERVIVATVALLVLGLGLDAFLALGDDGIANRSELAALGQALILSAGNFGLSGFLGSLIRSFDKAAA
jgi:glycosyltransferase involved in cell wall biosynthesis